MAGQSAGATALKAFITGASSGLGQALAVHYAGRGASLGLVARRGDALERLAERLPGRHRTYCMDVADHAAMSAAAADFLETLGAPDIVVANAGISVGNLTEHAEDVPVVIKVFATNVLGMVNTFQPFVDPMRSARAGRP